ncbi:hypothetical protein AA12717_3856 [Gluconacetobacter sacchari DSM 12717]|uniref:DUF2147 domain-containing protein n=3 Tax=Gluconacetobacter sacchari TaxID=92759 RepID=A0A7W4IAA6_9PROT|nr:DUF2147 domain-containing protein [Gluconacetobacter sacchari]MBB2159097.1 DUF2147 domain-containing protein [Gluconacetobacter sacchari]GBQ31722.1 hypothetical protein AA12717_3856 [Gluconacetobacter sacchari DSM 12717]
MHDRTHRRAGMTSPPRGQRRGWRPLAALAALGLLAGTPHPAAAAQTVGGRDASPVLGQWETRQHDGVFEIKPCGGELCGRLIGMRYTGEIPRARDGGSECGLLMLTGFVPDEDDAARWNGHILDPDSGKVYQAQIWSPRDGVLKLRGYVGIPLFGETHTWTRYGGTIGARCQMP